MWVAAILLPLALVPSCTARSARVQTRNGEIVGHPSSSHAEVMEYLGIPYAEPPVGALRFEEPQPYRGHSQYIASHYGRDCPYTPGSTIDYPNKTAEFDRIMGAFTSQNANNHSEDCLTLNVWAKPTAGSRLPVLVHFHGGRWTSGTTNTPFYDGSDLVSTESLIVVTATYRMNVFGFPGIPSKPSNLGLLDQRAAVEWVHQNIAAFGGDPDRIVLSGQSCGSAAADYWAYAYATDPLVAGLISHSGTADSFPANSPELSAEHWQALTQQLGCVSGDRLACMKRQNVSALLSAAGRIAPPPASSAARRQPVFQPTIDNVTVFGDYQARADAGRFARLPYLVGHNANEAGFYKISAWAQGSLLDEATWQAFNEDTFTCPTDAAAAARTAAQVPVWRFRYDADWANTRLYPTSGAYHGVELHMVFGNSVAVTGLPETAAQTQLRRLMQHAWATFVSDPGHGLDHLGWPRFSRHGRSLIRLGANNTPQVTFEFPLGCSE